jgi:dynamin 1-like protein
MLLLLFSNYEQYINTSHPDFIGGSRAVSRLMTRNNENNLPPTGANTSSENGVRLPVGATPMSATSSQYYNDDDVNGNGADPYDGNGGIMNFIFRGGLKSPPKGKSHGPGGPPTIVHLPQVPDTMKQTDNPPDRRERTEMEVIKSLIESYFNVVRKNFIDMVPKTIMFFLVNHVKDALQNELVSELYREAEMGSLMKEAEDVAQRRQTCSEMRDLLGKALDIVNEVRDYNALNQVE